MSYGVKYRCTHKADTNGNVTTYEIEILKLNYTGSITEVIGWEETFLLEYDRVNVREPFKTPINNANFEFYLAVRDAGDLAILNEIFTSDEDEYQLRLKQNTNVIWTGWILKDLLEYSNGDYPYKGVIRAKDLTRLSQYSFPLSNDRQKLIVTIAELLDDLGLGLDIYTYTNWDNDAFTGSDDFLNLTYHETRALRDYKENGDEDDTTQTNKFWLDALLRNFGLILRQANNAWRIYQLSGMTDGTSVTEYRYNSAGVKQSSTTADLSTTIDSDNRYILPSSSNYVLPAIKQANVVWNHRTPVSGIQLPLEVNLTRELDEEFTQLILSDGNQTISLKFDIFASFPALASGLPPANSRGQLQIKVVGTSTYYLQDDFSWSTDVNTYQPSLLFRKPLISGGFDASGSVNILTDELPAGADGTLTITFTGALNDEDFADTTQYTSFEFRINNDTVKKDSDTLTYSLTQEENFSYIYDHGTVYFGDGPTDFSDSAFRYGNADSELITDGWKRVGEASSDNFFKLLLREFIDLQATGVRLLEAEVYGYYQPNQMLVYEASDFFMLGGSLTGDNVWRVDFLALSYSLPTVDFAEIISRPGNAGFSGGTVNFLAERSASFQENQYITRTTSSLTGTITSIPVEAVSITIGKVGDPVYIFNIQSGAVDEFTLAESYVAGQTSLVVESGTVTGTAPEGSWIIYTGERLSSYITKTDNAITLGVRSADVALLSDDSIFTDETGNEYYFVEGDYTGQIIRSEALINIRADQILAQVSAIVGEDLTVLNDIVDDIAQLQSDVDNSETAIDSLQTTVSGLPTSAEFDVLESALEINTDSILLGVREFSYALFSDDDEFITADGDTFAFVDNGDVIGLIRYNESLINVESDRIDLKVREIGSASAIGVLSTARTGGNTYTQILLDDRTLSQDISLRDGDNLRLFNDAGQSEQVTVNGDQTLTKGNSSIQTVTIESKTLQNTYAAETSHLSFPGYQLGSEINVLKDEIVLKVDSNGDIAFIRLDGSADAGTEITINADQITVAGQTTFLSALGSEGFPTVSGINVTIRSATAPTIRTSGDALVTGDLWIETDNGDKPYTWNGTAWVAQYTVIDGGNITTGTIDASVVTVDNLDASNITAGTLSVNRIGAGSITANEIATGTITATQISAGTITATEIAANTITASQIAAGTITATELASDSVTADKIDVTDLNAVSTNTGSLTVSDTLTLGASGSVTWTGGDISTSGINLDLVSGTAFESAKGLSWGSSNLLKVYGLTAGSGQAISELVISISSVFEGDTPAIRLEADDVDINADVDISGNLTLGTDLALSEGGTGASLSDPGADRIMFWDESGNTVNWLQAGTGLTISGTSITTASDVTQFITSAYTGAPGSGVGKAGDIAYDEDLGGVYIKVNASTWVQVN